MKKSWFYVTLMVVLAMVFLPLGTIAAPSDPPTSSRSGEPNLKGEKASKTPPVSTPLPPRNADGVQIRLQQAVFDPLQTSPRLAQALTQDAYADDGTGYYLVQFNGPILPEWKGALADAGAVLHDYVPDFAFIVKMNAATAERVQALEMVRWVGFYQPAFRLSNALLPTVQHADPEKTRRIVVRSFTGEPTRALAAEFAGLGARVLAQGVDTGGGTIFELELPETAVANVARLPGVAWVQPKPEPRLANAVARSSVTMNKDAVEHALGIYGENQIVVVGDTGFSTGDTATMHPDFRGHFYKGSWGSGTCGTWADANGHGTHVAGSVLGNGVMDGAVTATHSYAGTNAGIAPEALLWGWGFCDDWSGLPDADPYNDYYGVMYADDPRARVNTNSWGYSASAGTYDAFSRETDRFIWDHPDMVVLFAAGNDGIDADSDGIVDEDSMGVPAGSKNIITVGASENQRAGNAFTWGSAWPGDYPADPINSDLVADDAAGMAAFSSRGPMDDGRLKPDVVAPGTNIVSTRDDSTTGWGVYNDHYLYMGGTSMATPLTAGAGAIVREFYTDTYGIHPTAALVKATLINGAYDMTPGQYRDEVPDGSQDDVIRRADINQGWGRVDLANALVYNAPRQLWFYEHSAGLATGGTYSVTLQTNYAENPFRVSLVWSDREGAEAAHGALVNDLDLEVTGPDGTVYYGNDIIDDGLLDGDVDHTNNVEGIDLAPAIGTYTVTVRGYNVPSGPQPFALVVSGDMEDAGTLQGTVSDAGTGLGIANAQIEATIVPTQTTLNVTSAGDGTYRTPLAPGTYTVTASAYGYMTQTANNVVVADGMTTTQDFALTPAPTYVLSGTVTDANTGWGLFASVEVIPDGYPAETIWTDPWTGAYSVTLTGNYTHTLNVAAWDGIPGYEPQSRQVNLSADTVEDFALEVDVDACEAPGYESSAVTLLSEDFESWPLPAGWNIVNHGGDCVWRAGSDGDADANNTGGSGEYADADSDACDSGTSMDTSLETSVLDLTGHTNPVLEFKSDMYFWSSDTYDVDLSLDGGATWPINLLHRAGADYRGPETITLPMPDAAGQSNVRVRFRYTGSWDYWWQVDEVRVFDTSCSAPADGGLLAGSVYDANTSADLTGAEVQNSLGEVVVAQATPGDPTLSDAFYALYAPTGSQTFTATMSLYQDGVVTGYPVQDGVTNAQDFFLDVGHLTLDPSAFQVWLAAGDSRTHAWTLTNVGAVTVDYTIFEMDSAPPTDVVTDGSFEGGTPNSDWNEFSRNFGTPLCDQVSCGADFSHTGSWYVWFGGTANEERGWVDQDVTLPTGVSTLSFWMMMGMGAGADGYMSVNLGGSELFRVTEDDVSDYGSYTQVSLDVSSFADGGTHNLRFEAYNADGANFDVFVDDVALHIHPSIAWLSESPTTGSIVDSGSQLIDVTFDAGALAPGIYTGTLRVSSDTPANPQDAPVELTVGTAYASVQTGNWSGSAWPGGTGTPTANDLVTITTGTTVTVDSALAHCYGLHVEPGGTLIIPQGNDLTVEGHVENYGKLVQTKPVLDNTYTEFLHLRNQADDETHYYGVEITPDTSGLGTTAVSIWGHHESTSLDEPGDTENRRIDINPTSQNAATVRFYYHESELESGHDYRQVRAWHWDNPGWSLAGSSATTGSLDEYYYVEEAGVSAYSPFVLKDSAVTDPTAIRVTDLAVGDTLRARMWLIGLFVMGSFVYRLWRSREGDR